jgi:hypothetical protein
MRRLIFLILLISTNSFGQECNDKVLIKKNIGLEKQIRELFTKDDFYLSDNSQYYMYAISLDKKLKVTEITTVFINNPDYDKILKGLLNGLQFKIITKEKDCNHYEIPFIINARLQTITYPTNSDFYKVELPIE